MNKKRIKKAIRELIIGIGENPNRPGLIETPKRVARMYEEICHGYEVKKNNTWNIKMFEGECDGLVQLKDIPFFSLCEHHLMPFFGKVTVNYMTKKGRVIGLSKVPRLIKDISQKLQLQERMTEEIAKKLYELMKPDWIEVYVYAEKHLCVSMRGAKSEMRTDTFVRIDESGIHHYKEYQGGK